jgi:hypothetical protein
MKKRKKTILISVLISLLAAYVTLYFVNVSPYGGEDTEAQIVLWSGWSPYYQKLEHRNAFSKTEQSWNMFIHSFFMPIHQVDKMLRPSHWLSAKEKQDKIYRATRIWRLKAPLEIIGSGYIMDGGSISIRGVDKNLTEFNIKLDRSIKTSREKLPQHITINYRQLEYGGSEEQQLAIDLNDWLNNSSNDTNGSTLKRVKEVIDAISDRT